ncbi:MAG: DMT family transporter [Alphaproteobacteria bacterium]|jgi:drug/metabolite transporter (DMT)-like permease|nr:DMT family transporter [Alphaproteobacteria bacterium]MDP6565325.1 DMT family transporter [Alphaproteobacteria bacterium]MDP6814161.1 DMT family transporter [Alphaproteobacteria bacterium]
MATTGGSIAQNNSARGIAYMCLAVALFPFLNASVKVLGADYATTQLVWMRYLGHFAFMLIIFLPLRGRALFHTGRPVAQFVRSLLLLASTASYFLALNYLPLTTAASIGFTSPFIVTALSVPLLGEKVGVRRWSAVVVGFIGALIIIRPGEVTFHGAELLVLASSACFATYQVITRRIAAHDDPATTITYTAVIGALFCSLVGPFYWTTPAVPVDWLLFAGLGLFGGFGHLFVVKAYQWAEVSMVSPFQYVQLVGATLLGFLIFGEFPDGWTWLGAAIIVACGVYITYREAVRTPAPVDR